MNIGIAYYKLNSLHNSKIYLNRIYNYKEAMYSDTFSYMSACYYLYKITNNKKYLEKIIFVGQKYTDLSEHAKRMMADTYIILKKYDFALQVLNNMDFALDLKKALLYIKLKDYVQAEVFLEKAMAITMNIEEQNTILWLMVFRDLKSNEIEKLTDHLSLVQERRIHFKSNFDFELKMFFNKNKFTPSQYLNLVSKFDFNRKIEYIFYFAPFVFSDDEEIMYDSSKGFIFQDDDNLESLEKMVLYNANFLKLIKEDPIIRVHELEKLINKDTKSYIYYNLALSYAHISDFHRALKYFEKAAKLNPGNKLYAVMTLIAAKRLDVKLNDQEYLETNIKSKKGLYNYFGQKLYSIIIDTKYDLSTEPENYKKTVFYKGLDFLTKFQKGDVSLEEPLLKENYKDPLVHLIKMTVRKYNENDFEYFSRLQDTIPLKINNNFLDGPLVVTNYYIDLLKALGLFSRASLEIEGSSSPSYLRTTALRDLHTGKGANAVKILEKLQSRYKLEDKYTMFLIVAGLLEDGKYNEASIQISLIKAILNDNGADFLTAVQLIQELKISSAKQFLLKPYHDSLIDFKLVGFDKLLESL